ncbi:MAG: Gldg family protein, partial [Planctomycetota bacterium]
NFRHSWRQDWTRDQRYAVSPETKQLLQTLPQRVEVVVPYFFSPDAMGRIYQNVFGRAMRALEEYDQLSPWFRVAKLVDVVREPTKWAELRRQREIDQHNRIYLFSGDRREVLGIDDLAQIRTPTMADPSVRAELISERVSEALANAIQRVAHEERPLILFTQGHGEISLERPVGGYSMRAFQFALGDRGYEVGSVNLRTESNIPEQARLVIVVASGDMSRPYQPLRGAPRRAVEQHLKRGGSLFLFLPVQSECGLEDNLKTFGITPHEGVVHVIGPSPGRKQGTTKFLYCRRIHEGSLISKDLGSLDFLAEVDTCGALQVEHPAMSILLTDPDCWLETSFPARKDHSDPRGPFTLMAASIGQSTSQEAEAAPRVVVFSSWSPVLDGYFQGDLRRLLLNAVYWLTDREELTATQWREDVRDQFVLTGPVRNAFFWTSVAVLPLCPLLGGLLVFFLRRR